MAKYVIYCMFLALLCAGCATTDMAQNPQSKGLSTAMEQCNTEQKIEFSPDYQSNLTDKYPEAIEIYESSPKVSQGVYFFEGLVFVVVEIDTRQENIEYLEGTALLRSMALLRSHFNILPQNFKVRNRLVEKEFDKKSGIYRYAVVYREKDIEKLLISSLKDK